ncbi:lactate utilization protein [Candidatus Woesearchaeota archaeon]|nr:lactate utilization protein [Candidatus Woesearchaeota archaeon]
MAVEGVNMDKWEKLADEESIKKTVAALKANGIEAFVTENGEEARKKVLEILPKGAEVMDMTSMTLDAIGVSQKILEPGMFNSVRKKLDALNWKAQGAEMRRLGAAPDWVVGSVHAVTEDGKVLVASASGSQLPAYAYSAGNVIWVVGAQKIVKNLDDGIRRIYDYTLPLEDARARKAYGMGSGVNKLLILSKEFAPGRITLVLVKEKLGF